MEILVYEDNIEKDYQTVAVIDWRNLDKKMKERPEDYIFILSPGEMNKFMELNKQICAGLKGKGMAINERGCHSQLCAQRFLSPGRSNNQACNCQGGRSY